MKDHMYRYILAIEKLLPMMSTGILLVVHREQAQLPSVQSWVNI
jgi:hypothetical protein